MGALGHELYQSCLILRHRLASCNLLDLMLVRHEPGSDLGSVNRALGQRDCCKAKGNVPEEKGSD